MMWPKNQSRSARKVGDHPNMVRLNFLGHLGWTNGLNGANGAFLGQIGLLQPTVFGVDPMFGWVVEQTSDEAY